MKQYTIRLDGDVSSFYEEIATVSQKSTEAILEETLKVVLNALSKSVLKSLDDPE